ncbi:MAG: NUDIX domain-containing protein [Candidatus Doudnabacteria bacterium]|nr:NUDIX domain-containing protein [Candidatus Doudnabacteria bacterium]
MAHYNYYVDLCADTYVVNNGAVLLRMHEKYHNWGSPGGHIDPGEDANQAAVREVWEETGLEIELVGPEGWEKRDTATNKDLVPPIFVNLHKINDTHNHSAFVFIARAKTREINPQTKEDQGAECRWFTLPELDELLSNDPLLRQEVHKYASTALRLIQ